MPANFTIKIRNGHAEFDAKSIQKLVKALLKELKPLLKRSKPERAVRGKAKKSRRGRKPKASYPAAAVKPLKAFLKDSKAKTHADTLVAIGQYHVQHFKVGSFTNKDLASAATAIGKKLGNISALLKVAEKAKKVKKLGKGTWQLLAEKAKAAKPRKVRKAKLAPNARVKKQAQAQPKAVSPKKTAKPKVKPFPKPNASKQPVQPVEPAPTES